MMILFGNMKSSPKRLIDMKKCLKIELSRSFTNWAFYITLGIGLVIAIWHYFQNVLPCVPYLDEYLSEKGFNLYPHSVYNKWMGGEAESFQPFLYFLLLPVLSVLPFAGTFFSDYHSGFVKSFFVRTKRIHYYFAKAVAVFLSAGVAVTLPLVVNFALTAMTLPALIPQSGAGTFPVFAVNLFAEIYYTRPMLYTAIYVLLIFIFSGLLPSIALTLSYVVENKFVVMLAPFILCLFLHSICGLFSNSAFDPTVFLNPSQPVSTLPILASQILFLLFCEIAFVAIGVRHDTY